MHRLAAHLILAVAALAAPLAAMPVGAREELGKARTALARGDGIAAEADLDRALAAGASRTELAADMGEALLQQGERGKARVWLAPGQFAAGEEARGWRLLGLLERLDGNLPAAGQALDRAMAKAPSDPLVWVEIGRLRYQGGEQLQAIEAADRAVAAGPDHARALELRAQLLRDSAGNLAALPLFERGLAAAPNDLLLLGGYAASLGELGRARDMLVVTRKMLSLDPGNAQAFYLQAVLAARAGNGDLARTMLSRTGDRLDAMPAALLLRAALELEAGNANVATELLLQLAARHGTNPRVQALLARALLEAGDHQQLFARFGGLAGRGDSSPYLLAILGRGHEEQGDRAAAAAMLDRSAAGLAPELLPLFERDPPGVLAPRWAETQASTALGIPYVRGLLAAGDTVAARRVTDRMLELRPGALVTLGLSGDVALLMGQPVVALERYDQAAQVRLSEHLMLRSAIALERAGEGAAVPNLVARYLVINPANQLATRIAANQALDRQDWATARTLLDSLRQRGGNRDARLLADLSLAQWRSGDAAAAVESATRACQLAPASAYAVQARALALVAAGRDPDIARQLLEQARKSAGENPLLAEARRKLR